ncbi:MAG: hypothetical protein JO272_10000 [Pseudonocardiales bacterium]|nr:hypothetical protein [Pseudonocardiales bacterium]
MALKASRLSVEPLMDSTDKLAAQEPPPSATASGQTLPTARPFGVRFAVSPVRCGKHSKTYYTVTVEETTHIHLDGKEEIRTDYVERERED